MKQAPNFELKDQDGKTHTLKDYAGRWLVLYFYPRDNTPGCTAQACAFRDGRDLIAELGAEVVGVSKDSVKSHAKFRERHDLNFTILSDESTETIQAFGSWKLKKFMGREFMGISRDTYLIDPKGNIVKKYEGVNPRTSFKEIYDDLKELTT